MRIISSLLLCLLLTSCASDAYNQPHVPNGCMIDAANFQKKIQASNPLWARIISIKQQTGLKQWSHAMCVYRMRNGQVYIYDMWGTTKVFGDGEDPTAVARQALPNVVSARYL